jgi:hypothetical protein
MAMVEGQQLFRNSPLQAFPNRSKAFQAFFRKKKIVYFSREARAERDGELTLPAKLTQKPAKYRPIPAKK